MTDEVQEVPEQETPGSELSTIERLELISAGYDPDMDFRKLALEATYIAAGYRLVKKADLIGICHAIVGVTYREGMPRKGKRGDYVSVEAVVADPDTLARLAPRDSFYVTGEGSPTVYPNEPVVYNDSGTGVRRALTAYFHDLQMIDVGKAKEGEEWSSRFDRPVFFWANGEEAAMKGFTSVPDGRKLAYIAPRGLRVSEYEFAGGSAETYYFG